MPDPERPTVSVNENPNATPGVFEIYETTRAVEGRVKIASDVLLEGDTSLGCIFGAWGVLLSKLHHGKSSVVVISPQDKIQWPDLDDRK